MEKTEIRRAGINDLNLLIQLRIDFLNDGDEKLTQSDERQLLIDFSAYLKSDNVTFIAFLAYTDGLISGSIFMSQQSLTGIPPFQSKKYGILTNVYVYPEFRNRGIASKLIKRIIAFAKNEKFDYLELIASEELSGFYSNLGFSPEVKYGDRMQCPISS